MWGQKLRGDPKDFGVSRSRNIDRNTESKGDALQNKQIPEVGHEGPWTEHQGAIRTKKRRKQGRGKMGQAKKHLAD